MDYLIKYIERISVEQNISIKETFELLYTRMKQIKEEYEHKVFTGVYIFKIGDKIYHKDDTWFDYITVDYDNVEYLNSSSGNYNLVNMYS